MTPTQYAAIKQRIADYKVDHQAEQTDELETYEQIRDRFEGRDLDDIAARMFRR